jgi:hypothetical protein
MQAIALVTGDEFLLQYNSTIDTEDVLDFMLELHTNWSQYGFTKYAHFDDYYGIDFALVIGSAGFCYNFNMINAGELFNLEM